MSAGLRSPGYTPGHGGSRRGWFGVGGKDHSGPCGAVVQRGAKRLVMDRDCEDRGEQGHIRNISKIKTNRAALRGYQPGLKSRKARSWPV